MSNISIKNIPQRKPIIILFFFCFLINVYFCSANENIKKYFEKNNMNYPYNLNTNIKKSYFMDRTSEDLDEGKYIKRLELTIEQNNLLVPFFSKLEVINNSNNFMELKEQKNVIAFSVIEVFICKDTPQYEDIYVTICFYSDKKLGDMSKYDNENNFWYVHNIAIYSKVDYKFRGWVF
jgi:hypothetical protein